MLNTRTEVSDRRMSVCLYVCCGLRTSLLFLCKTELLSKQVAVTRRSGFDCWLGQEFSTSSFLQTIYWTQPFSCSTYKWNLSPLREITVCHPLFLMSGTSRSLRQHSLIAWCLSTGPNWPGAFPGQSVCFTIYVWRGRGKQDENAV
jgi:hypothetical protein